MTKGALTKADRLVAFAVTSRFPLIGGWGNGYVAIPSDHPYFGLDYGSIEGIEVHGGLTYSGTWQDWCPDECRGMWVFGFDTAHAYDSLENWPDAQSVLNEANRLKDQLLLAY